MVVGITQALRVGARAVACASTGNTSSSLAAYAAQVGRPAFVFLPAGKVSMGKVAQTLAYGARGLAVRGDFDAALRLATETCQRLGIYLLNSGPVRIEGRSIVWEILQDLAGRSRTDAVTRGTSATRARRQALRGTRGVGITRVPRISRCRPRGQPLLSRLAEASVAASVSPETGRRRPHRRPVKTIARASPSRRPRLDHVADEEILDARARRRRRARLEPASRQHGG